MSGFLYEKELEIAKSLAREAADYARERSRLRLVSPTQKSNQSYVTDLDMELEKRIRQELRSHFPNDQLTGEEYAADGEATPRCWSIDPIDGTGNLVHDLPLWSISIGLLLENQPVVGVIAVPMLNELYWAAQGQGAWLNGTQLAPLSETDSDKVHSQDNINIGTKAMKILDPRSNPGRFRGMGSACCEQVFLATGRLKACVFMGEYKHDLAAGAAILSELGAAVATIDGQSLTFTQFVEQTPVPQPTLVAAPLRLQALLQKIRRAS